jgi:hypothetical protein
LPKETMNQAWFNLNQERSLTKQTRHFASEGPTLQILVGPALAKCRVTNVKNREVQFMTKSSLTYSIHLNRQQATDS